ncbi:putative aminomethyltransferase, mitochondrial [Wickerhamiella sorbophila]|uniref:Aminomethyltransferase n=1 Tax=Wickerhamiella sorbophila TaxID=45607 RepID=A0A2T0FHS9_9ASCO|nr:putative aminomethyltransferase, mitochondrial [Wickerhamiella sorbophila]PRT54535.1 putative aminomethyltransferase, mitochondrial [Wickerhamiella sorbophila]
MLGKRFYSDIAALRKTPLFDFHLAHEGKMVDYAGFAMPVLYKAQSHIASHNWVREKAGLFDVSHMVQHKFLGPDATKFLETITPSDLKGLKPFTSTLSVLLNSNGGIVDDTIICKHAENEYYVVTNAGCRDKDLAFFREQASRLGVNVRHDLIGGGLLALQGPEAANVLQKLTNFDLKEIGFGESAFVDLLGGKYHVARGGYTGEDGFEVSVTDDAKSLEFANALVENEAVQPIGLAARDSLRLEAGMCLYGNELTEEITPIAARLAWVIGKPRRADKEFNGAEEILKQLAEKSTPLRTGLVSTGPAPRTGAKILDKDGSQVGTVTSGSLSPTLGKNVAMGYLPRKLAKNGTELSIEIRGKPRPAVVSAMPFVTPNYYRK